jgi:GNAT superfamily N-acetyltransferase
MEDLVPFLEDALRRAERKLGEALGGDCRVNVYVHMSDELAYIVEGMDHRKFRPELQYTLEELRERGGHRGFALFMLTCSGEPTAYLLGYTNDEGGDKFFLDSVATLVEGKGVGSILVTLALVYCYEVGYTGVELYTEEADQEGRHIVRFYEDLGFSVRGNDPKKGVFMISKMTPSQIRYACVRYIGLENETKDFNPIHYLE